MQSSVLAGLSAFAAVLVVMIAVMIWSIISYRAEISNMNKKVAELSKREEQFSRILSEREQLTKNLSTMTALVSARQFSWAQLFSRVEAVFPVGAALQRLECSPRDHSLMLDGEAQSPEILRTLMMGMEKSSSFKDIALKHQSVEKGHISFNVVGLYQQDKNTGVAARQ